MGTIQITTDLLLDQFQVHLGVILLLQFGFLLKGGYVFSRGRVLFLSPPFPFVAPLPRVVHNSATLLLPIAAVAIMIGEGEVAGAACLLASIMLFYLAIFCYSGWHHDIFLNALVLFLLGLYFTLGSTDRMETSPFFDLIRSQITIVYLFAGLAKLNRQTLRTDLLANTLVVPRLRALLGDRRRLPPFNALVTLSELALPILLWVPNSTVLSIALVSGVSLHMGMVILTRRGRTFHALMPAVYVLFLIPYLEELEGSIMWLDALIVLPTLSVTLVLFDAGIPFKHRAYRLLRNALVQEVAVDVRQVDPLAGGRPLILFDGVCNLCNGFVSFVLRHEKNEVHLFSTMQGETARELLARYYGNVAEEFVSVALYYNGRIFFRSTAILVVVQQLGGLWELAVVAMLIPRFLRDWIYDSIIAHRYNWFGKRDSCVVPTPELKERFLS